MRADALTARELAAMRLSVLPSHPNKIRERARREQWPAIELGGRGGVRLAYLIATLPADVRAELEHRATSDETEQLEAPVSSRDLDAVPDRMRRRAAERMTVLAALADELELAPSLSAAIAKVRGEHSADSVRRWWGVVAKLARTDWLAALVPGYRATAKPLECHPQAWEYFRDLCQTKSRMPEAEAYRKTVVVAAAQGWEPVPSVDSMRRRLAREVPVAVRTFNQEGSKRLAALYPAQERDRSVFDAMAAWCADGHRLDLRVRWPDGTVERPILLAWQDLASGLIVGWRVDRTENSDLVRLSFLTAVRAFGVPGEAYLDNGRAFASKLITGGTTNRFRGKVLAEEPAGILTHLGVRVRWATPEHGQAKPIERAFGDLTNSLSKHPAFDGAYLGRSTMHKPANYRDDRAVPLAEFLRVADVAIREHNTRRGRRSAVCAGRSFEETFRASYAEAEVRRATEAQLRTLLLAAEAVRVRAATGDIYLEKNRFWSPALVDLAGSLVTIRFDPDDLQAGIHVYRQDGRYVTFADCIQKTGFADMQAARVHAKARRQWTNAVKAQAEAASTFSPAELAELHLNAAGAPAIAAPPAKVIAPMFGVRTEPVPETARERMRRTEEERSREQASAELVTDLGKPLLATLRKRAR